MKDCNVKKYKKTVSANIRKLGEAWITALPNKEITIRWSSYNSETDVVRIVSGNGTIRTATNGYIVTAGSEGCVIGASEKYRISQVVSDGTEVCFEVNAEDFSCRLAPISQFSRAKVIGELTSMFDNNTLAWFEHFDLSEAYGVFSVASNVNTLKPVNGKLAPQVQLSFSSALTALKKIQGVFKTTNMPITYIPSSVIFFFDEIGNTSVNLVGNISEMTIITGEGSRRINVNGPQLVGDLRAYIASCAAKSSGSIRFLNTDKSGMTFYETVMANNDDFAGIGVIAEFSANEIVVKYKNDTTVLSTYNKSTQTWS